MKLERFLFKLGHAADIRGDVSQQTLVALYIAGCKALVELEANKFLLCPETAGLYFLSLLLKMGVFAAVLSEMQLTQWHLK